MSHGEASKEGTEDPSRVTLEELTTLLRRIEEFEQLTSREPDVVATVDAVCEATGAHPNRVRDLLEQIRREDIESRLAQRLREAEEPMYRVERPGFETDPLSRHTYLGRERTLTTLLETLPRPDRPTTRRPLKLVETPEDRIASRLALMVLAMIALLTAALVCRAILVGLPR